MDDFRSIRDNLFKVLAGRTVVAKGDDDDSGLLDAGAARALVSALFARAGKGKDEVVQIVAREIGMAVAHMLKEPLAQLAKNQKLQISFEFVPKDHDPQEHAAKEPRRKSQPPAAAEAPAQTPEVSVKAPGKGKKLPRRVPTKRSPPRAKPDIGG